MDLPVEPLRVVDRVVSDGLLALLVGRARRVQDVQQHVGVTQVVQELVAQPRTLTNRKSGTETMAWEEGRRI